MLPVDAVPDGVLGMELPIRRRIFQPTAFGLGHCAEPGPAALTGPDFRSAASGYRRSTETRTPRWGRAAGSLHAKTLHSEGTRADPPTDNRGQRQ